MNSDQSEIGLIGLGVMGENLALNIEHQGFSVSVYNRTTSDTIDFAKRWPDRNIYPTYNYEEFVSSLKRPRSILLMITAGAPIDAVLTDLVPMLDQDDMVIDGGNSHFKDTERRLSALREKGLLYIGMGISGGAYGALHGPSLMPGGRRQGYDRVGEILKGVAAKVNGEPCATYLGPRGVGHYVKTVHNGIEYALMQLIAEIYDLLSRGGGLAENELHEVFAGWNRGELSSYLIQITADILAMQDTETGKPLLDVILDEAEQKGTGKWASQDAMDLGVPVPTIDMAVENRFLSARKEERVAASRALSGPATRFQGDRDALIQDARAALFVAEICSYAQGMELLRAASQEYKYNLDLEAVARIWRGGCIIRAALLNDMAQAFKEQEAQWSNVLLSPYFARAVEKRQDALRRTIQIATGLGIPCPALSASLAYYDSYRTARLPANLIQAQRDYFGAHTYRRIDRPGIFHTEWDKRPLPAGAKAI